MKWSSTQFLMAKSDTGFKLVDGWLCLTNSYEVFFLFFWSCFWQENIPSLLHTNFKWYRTVLWVIGYVLFVIWNIKTWLEFMEYGSHRKKMPLFSGSCANEALCPLFSTSQLFHIWIEFFLGKVLQTPQNLFLNLRKLMLNYENWNLKLKCWVSILNY